MFNRIFLVVCYFCLFFICETLVWADGVFESSQEVQLRSPQQKAIIAWDGKREQMIVASQVQSNEITNMVWLIPIQSQSKPQVQKSDINIFEQVAAFFGAHEPGNFSNRSLIGSGKGVELIESKKVDIYDVVILKSSSAQELIDWLNINGYKTPVTAEPIIDSYIQKQPMYFVVNKIDLDNKFKDPQKDANDLYGQIKQNLEDEKLHIKDTTALRMDEIRKQQMAFCSSWKTLGDVSGDVSVREGEFDNCKIDKVKERFEQMGKSVHNLTPSSVPASMAALSIDGHLRISFLINNYHNLRAFEISYDREDELAGGDTFGNISKANRQVFMHIPKDVLDQVDNDTEIVGEIFQQATAFKNRIDDKFRESYWIDQTLSRLSETTPQMVYCQTANLEWIFTPYIKDVALSSIKWPDPSVTQSEYCQTLGNLQSGMATPLKISFEPKVPYYPLLISSLGEGSAMIETYVIGNDKALDHNGILADEKHFALNDSLRTSLVQEFGDGPWNYITRFIWSGQLKDLNKDAEFYADR